MRGNTDEGQDIDRARSRNAQRRTDPDWMLRQLSDTRDAHLGSHSERAACHSDTERVGSNKAARKVEDDKAKAVADFEAQRVRGAAPAFEVTEAPTNGDGAIRVTVDRAINGGEAYSIMEVLMLDYTDPGAFFVSINCSSGSTPTYDHRLGNGKIAVGELGHARTGFVRDGAMVDLVKGCDVSVS